MTDTFDPDDPGVRDDPLAPFAPEEFDPYEDLEDLTGGEVIAAVEDPSAPVTTPPRSPLLTGLIVLLLLVVLSIAAFQFLRDDEPDVTAGQMTTEASGDSPTTAGPSDTQPTTTSTPATTVDDGATFAPYEAKGAVIPVSELTLAVDAIGPILLGESAEDAIGQLIASLGEPAEDSGPVKSSGDYGSCDGATERIVRFGALVAIVVVDPNGLETFGGYRLDLDYGGLQSATVNIETLSGLKVGNSFAQLESIYERFDVKIVTDAELGDVFELRNSNGVLLLWGPVSALNGFVRGIYSPDACGRFG